MLLLMAGQGACTRSQGHLHPRATGEICRVAVRLRLHPSARGVSATQPCANQPTGSRCKFRDRALLLPPLATPTRRTRGLYAAAGRLEVRRHVEVEEEVAVQEGIKQHALHVQHPAGRQAVVLARAQHVALAGCPHTCVAAWPVARWLAACALQGHRCQRLRHAHRVLWRAGAGEVGGGDGMYVELLVATTG